MSPVATDRASAVSAPAPGGDDDEAADEEAGEAAVEERPEEPQPAAATVSTAIAIASGERMATAGMLPSRPEQVLNGSSPSRTAAAY
jgi:hypothetical protein